MKTPLWLSIITPLILCALLTTSCARNIGSNVYTDSATPGKVLEGTILFTRAVTIKAHDKLQDNTVGGLGGAAAGGLAGAQVGHDNGSLASGIGGALVGAVAGAYLQDALSTSEGMEYIVKLDAKYMQQNPQPSKKTSIKSTPSNEDTIKSSIDTDTKTDIVSVVQASDPALHEGSHVYIVYNDDRPRLVADKQH